MQIHTFTHAFIQSFSLACEFSRLVIQVKRTPRELVTSAIIMVQSLDSGRTMHDRLIGSSTAHLSTRAMTLMATLSQHTNVLCTVEDARDGSMNTTAPIR